MKEYPDVKLRVYGNQQRDLEFLRFFPFLKRVQIDVTDLENFDGLRYLPDFLEYFGLQKTRRKLSLKQLERFTQLKELWIEGQDKDFKSIGKLTNLIWLSLRSITLKDLSALLPLENLRLLEIKLGGSNNLALIPQIGKLRYLELWCIRQLSDLSFLSQLSELRFLSLQTLKHFDNLPSFAPLSELRWLSIESLKSLHDLAPVSEAPALEQILFIDMPQFDPSDFSVFIGHPTLKRANVGLCSTSKNDMVSKLLALPGVYQLDPNRRRSHQRLYCRQTGEDVLR